MADERHLTHKQKQENRIVDRVVEIVKPLVLQQAEPVRKQDLGKFFKFMESMRLFAAGATFTACTGAVYAYFSLMGLVDMSPARVVLGCAWLFSVLFVWEIGLNFDWKSTERAWVVGLLALLLVAVFWGLDNWTVKKKSQNELASNAPIEEIHHDVVSGNAAITQLSEKIDGIKSTEPQPTQSHKMGPEAQSVCGGIVGNGPGFIQFTELPTSDNVIEAGKKLAFNLFYCNKGNTYVHNVESVSWGYFAVGEPLDAKEDLIQQSFRAVVQAPARKPTVDIAPGASTFQTINSDPLSAELAKGLIDGTSRLYLMAYVGWTVNNRADHLDICSWVQPPKHRGEGFTPRNIVWHYC